MIRFTVPAVPVAQPRPRATIRGGHARVYGAASKHPVNAFKAAVAAAYALAHGGAPMDGPVSMSVLFVMPRPKRLIWKSRPMPRVPHTSKPDADNLCKSAVDALLGLAFIDDSQIWALSAEKMYARGDEQPHVEITLTGDTLRSEEQ